MLKQAKDLALANLWICLAIAQTKWYVQAALGLVSAVQLVLVWSQSKERNNEVPHVGGGLTSSAASVKE